VYKRQPEETELFHVSRTNNNIDHVVIKIKDKDLYGDADGWHTKSELFSKMKNQERVDVEYLLPVDQQQIKIPLFHDISESIQNSFKRNHFLQFEIPDTSIKVSWNVFDPGSASITSELGSNECGGPWSGAVDAIESIVLSHFCSGVDILDSPYIDGLISSLFAIGDNMDDCDCNDCVNET